jgi:flavin-dependent dehydrogenase
VFEIGRERAEEKGRELYGNNRVHGYYIIIEAYNTVWDDGECVWEEAEAKGGVQGDGEGAMMTVKKYEKSGQSRTHLALGMHPKCSGHH